MIDQNKIREILKQAGLEINPSEEDFGKAFQEIGLDSLDVFSFLSEIEMAVGISISDSDFEKINTLNDVISFLNK